MSHFAELDENNTVLRVIVAEQDFIDALPGRWVQTSYNTQGGVHLLSGTPLRKNYAGIGFIYDEGRDAFISPQPFASWALDEATCIWQAPVPMPDDGKLYMWDEDALAWIERSA